MATVTDNDLKELKDFLGEQFKEVNSKIDRLSEDINGVKVELATIKGQIAVIDARLKILETSSQKIPDLAEKVGELKNWKQIALTLGGALIGGVITYLIKTPNP